MPGWRGSFCDMAPLIQSPMRRFTLSQFAQFFALILTHYIHLISTYLCSCMNTSVRVFVRGKVTLSQQLSVCGIWSNCVSTKNSFIFNERPPTHPSPHALTGCSSSDTCWSIWMFREETVPIRLTTVTFICARQCCSNYMSNISHLFFSSDMRGKVCQCTMPNALPASTSFRDQNQLSYVTLSYLRFW